MRYVRLFNIYEEASADETLVTPNVTLVLDSSSLLSYDSGYSDESLMIRRDKDGKLIIGPGA